MELCNERDMHVCTLLPATIDTPLFQHAANYSGKAVQAKRPVFAPEYMAEAIVEIIPQAKRDHNRQRGPNDDQAQPGTAAGRADGSVKAR